MVAFEPHRFGKKNVQWKSIQDINIFSSLTRSPPIVSSLSTFLQPKSLSPLLVNLAGGDGLNAMLSRQGCLQSCYPP